MGYFGVTQPVKGVVTPSPRLTPPPSPLFLAVRLPVSHQCSPFFSAAVTESPALFPVVKARCLVTTEGGVFIAEGAFAEGREVHFLSLTVEHNTEPQLPEAHSTLLSLNCWSWLHRLHVPKVVYINQEWS